MALMRLNMSAFSCAVVPPSSMIRKSRPSIVSRASSVMRVYSHFVLVDITSYLSPAMRNPGASSSLHLPQVFPDVDLFPCVIMEGAIGVDLEQQYPSQLRGIQHHNIRPHFTHPHGSSKVRKLILPSHHNNRWVEV